MKRMVHTFLLLFSCLLLRAQNNVLLVCGDGSRFKAYVKERAVNREPQASVLMEHVTEDTLYLKIEFENSSMYGITLYLLEKGLPASHREFSYRIALHKNKVLVSYLSSGEILPLPDPLVPPAVSIDSSAKYRNNLLAHFCEVRNGRAVFFNNLPAAGGCTVAMPEEYLNYTAQLMHELSSPEKKQETAEQVCRNNCLNAAQLNVMLGYVSYELDKLQLVRLAYYNLVDPQNAGILDKSFKLDASINELHRFLDHAGDFKIRAANTCLRPSPAEDIKKLSDNLTAVMGDTQRLEVLKKLYNNYCYSTDQVIFILQTLIHDREKLEAARLLYFNCTEKSSYLKVSEVFTYPQQGDELKAFLEKQSK